MIRRMLEKSLTERHDVWTRQWTPVCYVDDDWQLEVNIERVSQRYGVDVDKWAWLNRRYDWRTNFETDESSALKVYTPQGRRYLALRYVAVQTEDTPNA